MSSDWRAGLAELTVAAIEDAIEALHSDEWFEDQYERMTATLARLEKISETAVELVELLSHLSPIAKALLHDEGLKLRADIGHYGLKELSARLRVLGDVAPQVAQAMLDAHSPTRETGQGSNSAVGRVTDLHAFPAGDDDIRDLGIRRPADRFGFAVLTALIRYECGDRSKLRGLRGEHRKILDKVWLSVSEQRLPDWDRLLNARRRIAQYVDRMDARAAKDEEIWEHSWLPVLAKHQNSHLHQIPEDAGLPTQENTPSPPGKLEERYDPKSEGKGRGRSSRP